MEVVCISSDSSAPPSPTSNDKSVTRVRRKICSQASGKSNKESCLTDDSHDRGNTLSPGSASASDGFPSLSNVSEGDASDAIAGRWKKKTDSNHGDVKAKRKKGENRSDLVKAEKEQKRIERERKAAERKLKKEEEAKEKLLKKAAAEAKRANKPVECLKHMQVQVDQRLLEQEYGGELLVALKGADLQYSIREQMVPGTVTWLRTMPEHTVGDDMKVHVTTTSKEENMLLVVLPCTEVMKMISSQALQGYIGSMQDIHPNKKVTLLVYGLGSYLRLHPHNDQPKGRVGGRQCVTRPEFERAMAEVQVLQQCCHRSVDTPQELGEWVIHFTKAIAERPFKLEKEQMASGKLEWYATGDSRKCVRVDKNGLGLLQLWQQQLCQFHLAGLEVAEAIVSAFPSPRTLLRAYDKCTTQTEAEQLLKDIPIRRGVGPLSQSRKLGPELSRKVYVLFNAVDGDVPLSGD